MQLIICEKPSVGMSIAAALGVNKRKNGYLEGNGMIVSWCIGHLVGLADAGCYDEKFKKWRYEDLPILPDPFRFILSTGKEEQFSILNSLMERPDVESLVNACDAGREGELIFRLVTELAGCKKTVYRLWVSSMEESAIREGFNNLKSASEYDPLYQSALCRQQADWLIGINATRLFSVLYHHTLNVGRVQTPTLSMLVQRDSKISLFQKEKYYLIHLGLEGTEAVSEKFTSLKDAELLQNSCQGTTAVCSTVETIQKTIHPPKLFDLTTLQREANRLFGYTAKQTLDCAQSLYEKKLITYPRTDSRYLTSDMAETATSIFHLTKGLSPFTSCPEFSPNIPGLLSDKDVSDHHAIIPTRELKNADVLALPIAERNLLLLVGSKLLCSVADPHVYEAVTATFTCGGHLFTAKGKRMLVDGWKFIDNLFRTSLKNKLDEVDKNDDNPLPVLNEGQTFQKFSLSITEHFTAPPKPYTEDTLLSAMENAGVDTMPDDAERKGLGTPATRATIIEKLVTSGFVVRSGKNLLPTKDGVNLITVLPDLLTSPLLTAEWEQLLSQIAKGQSSPDDFMDAIRNLAVELVATYSHINQSGQKLFASEKESIGSCPRCGESIYEGKKNFFCGNRGCGFTLWKNDRFWTSRKKELTKKMAADLLRKGRVNVKGMYSEKKNTTYDAMVILDDTGGKYVNFKLEFDSKKKPVKHKSQL